VLCDIVVDTRSFHAEPGKGLGFCATHSDYSHRRRNQVTTRVYLYRNSAKMVNKAAAEAAKNAGNTLFKNGQYAAAIEKYKEAVSHDGSQAAYWSNMSACYEKLGKFSEMADASRACIKADKSFIKGYFRLATAQKGLGQNADCIKTLESGLALQPNNTDLKKMKKELQEVVRSEQVAAYCQQAEQQYKQKDIVSAYKTLELARRLDGGNNKQVEKLVSIIQPAYDKFESSRKSKLSGPDLYKEKGDEKYKNAQFEEAIVEYTKCLDLLKQKGQGQSETALKAYSNRAACYKQISNFDGVIEDCTSVLEVEPRNVKALVRRAQAFEGVERYRMALTDVKFVLGMGVAEIGKSNFDLCNQMQHRLQKTVDTLKKMNSS
jgi:stress-induced-phosphoprotein 1